MSDPATAIPGLIRAVRTSVEEHIPSDGLLAQPRTGLVLLLWSAEMMAECLIEMMLIMGFIAPQRPPQQFHAPLGENSPLVPRRSDEPGA